MKLSDFSLASIGAGFVAVLIGFASSVVIVFQAAQHLGASQAQMTSWLLALGLGMGLSCILLSLYTKAPVLTAWSTPGAAVLATSVQQVNLEQATGAFLFAALLTIIAGLSGWFEKFIKLIPSAIASAMLAGVLLPFGLDIFTSLAVSPQIVLPMTLAYLISRRYTPAYSVIWVLVTGVICSSLHSPIAFEFEQWQLPQWQWVTPQWNWEVILGLGLPLFIVTMTAQNIPGVAILRSFGYQKTPVSPLITGTGITSALLAPFGGFAFNLAAITAAICANPDAHPQQHKRYTASIAAGFFYLLTALAGGGIIMLFSALPTAIINSLAGLALLGVITQSLTSAFADSHHRDSAGITLLLTLSGASFFGLAAPFWGLLGGLAFNVWTKKTIRAK